MANISDINFNIIFGGQGGSSPQLQSDWTQADNTKVDYIKNKPSSIVTDIEVVQNIEKPDPETIIKNGLKINVSGSPFEEKNFVIPIAGGDIDGLMLSTDKKKLDGLIKFGGKLLTSISEIDSVQEPNAYPVELAEGDHPVIGNSHFALLVMRSNSGDDVTQVAFSWFGGKNHIFVRSGEANSFGAWNEIGEGGNFQNILTNELYVAFWLPDVPPTPPSFGIYYWWNGKILSKYQNGLPTGVTLENNTIYKSDVGTYLWNGVEMIQISSFPREEIEDLYNIIGGLTQRIETLEGNRT